MVGLDEDRSILPGAQDLRSLVFKRILRYPDAFVLDITKTMGVQNRIRRPFIRVCRERVGVFCLACSSRVGR